MKILIVSDIHSDYVAAESAYHAEKPDCVLDCGDHEEIKNLFESVFHFYIHGNHEPKNLKVSLHGKPLPHKIISGQVISLSYEDIELKISGLDGNYSNQDKTYSVKEFNVERLREIPEGGLDVLLTHESPLNVDLTSNYRGIAQKVIEQIDRINPKLVFSGHSGKFREFKTPNGVKNIVLDDLRKGYAVLDGKTFEFKRVYSRFR